MAEGREQEQERELELEQQELEQEQELERELEQEQELEQELEQEQEQEQERELELLGGPTMTKYADRLLFTALMLLAFAGVQAAGTPRKTTSLRSDANPQAMVVLHPKTMKYHCEGVKVRYAVTGGIRMTQQEALAKGAVPTKLFGVPAYCK